MCIYVQFSFTKTKIKKKTKEYDAKFFNFKGKTLNFELINQRDFVEKKKNDNEVILNHISLTVFGIHSFKKRKRERKILENKALENV